MTQHDFRVIDASALGLYSSTSRDDILPNCLKHKDMPILHYPIRLNAIAIFLTRAFQVDDKYVKALDKEHAEEEWDESGEIDPDEAFDALLDYQEIVARAVLGELNALVEYELKWIAKSIRRKHHGKSLRAEKKLTREKAAEIIENEFHIKLTALPGFSEVDEVRKVTNAYKHDDGYSGEYIPFFNVSIEKRYELDPDKAAIYLNAVREFLHALPGDRHSLGGSGDVRVKR